MNKHTIYIIICAGIIFAMLAAGCSGAAVSPAPTLPPSPTDTPSRPRRRQPRQRRRRSHPPQQLLQLIKKWRRE
jgi:hypothetical protein